MARCLQPRWAGSGQGSGGGLSRHRGWSHGTCSIGVLHHAGNGRRGLRGRRRGSRLGCRSRLRRGSRLGCGSRLRRGSRILGRLSRILGRLRRLVIVISLWSRLLCVLGLGLVVAPSAGDEPGRPQETEDEGGIHPCMKTRNSRDGNPRCFGRARRSRPRRA